MRMPVIHPTNPSRKNILGHDVKSTFPISDGICRLRIESSQIYANTRFAPESKPLVTRKTHPHFTHANCRLSFWVPDSIPRAAIVKPIAINAHVPSRREACTHSL